MIFIVVWKMYIAEADNMAPIHESLQGIQVNLIVLLCSGNEMKYHNYPKFSDRQASANSVDPDQTAPRGANFWVSKILGFLR